MFYLFICLSVTAAATAVVLITAAAVVLVASVITCKHKDKNDEKNPIAVASVTKKHFPDLLSPLPLHNMKEILKSAGKCRQLNIFLIIRLFILYADTGNPFA